MTILSRNMPTRLPEPAPMRATRIACPRCATVNCTVHTAGTLTSRPIAQHWRGA